MDQGNEFNENSGIFDDSRTGGINIDAFKAFIKKYGAEQAKGYLQALRDLYPTIQVIARGEIVGRTKGVYQGDVYFISPKDREKRAKTTFCPYKETFRFRGVAWIYIKHSEC